MRFPFGGFYGDPGKRVEIAGIGLSEVTYAPGAELPRHSHDAPYFCLVLRGSYEETVGRQQRHCTSATLLFHPAGETHCNRFGSVGGVCFNLELNASWTDRFKAMRHRFDEPVHWNGGAAAGLAVRAWREFQSMDDLSHLAIESLALEMLVSTSRRTAGKSSHRPAWLKQAEAFIRDRFDGPMSLNEIAAAVNRHPVHVAREFRRGFGGTIGAYIRRLRVEKACACLRTSREPLALIALSCGFSSQAHFGTQFRMFTGLSPARYREMFQGAKRAQ